MCVYDVEAACVQSWLIPAPSAFYVSLAHVGVRVSVSLCIECMGCVPVGLFQRDHFDVSRIAHDRTSSSGSQSKAFRSHKHFHWIYKVQLKLGGIQVHE